MPKKGVGLLLSDELHSAFLTACRSKGVSPADVFRRAVVSTVAAFNRRSWEPLAGDNVVCLQEDEESEDRL